MHESYWWNVDEIYICLNLVIGEIGVSDLHESTEERHEPVVVVVVNVGDGEVKSEHVEHSWKNPNKFALEGKQCEECAEFFF